MLNSYTVEMKVTGGGLCRGLNERGQGKKGTRQRQIPPLSVCVCVTQSENKYRYMDIEHMLCFGGVRGEWTDTLYRPLCM